MSPEWKVLIENSNKENISLISNRKKTAFQKFVCHAREPNRLKSAKITPYTFIASIVRLKGSNLSKKLDKLN